MDYFEQIEAYINSTLSESERLAFEAAMESDAKLKQAVEDHTIAMDVVGSILEDEVRKVIADELLINNEQLKINNGDEGVESEKLITNTGVGENGVGGGQREGKITQVWRMDWMRWAAAAAVVFVMGWWGMNGVGRNQLENDIFSNYYSPSRSGGVRGEMPAKATSKDSIQYYFSLNKFQKSLDVIDNIKEEDLSESLIMYKAENLFNLNKYNKVVEILEAHELLAPQSKELLFYSYLLNGQKAKAKSIISSLNKDQIDKVSGLIN